MNIQNKIQTTLVCWTAFVLFSFPAWGDTFFQTVNDTSDSSPNWTDEIWGPGPSAPSAGNDYISDGNTVTQLRTGNSGSTTTFDGDTLTLRNGVLFVTKSNFQGNIILESDGTISAGDSDDMTGGSLTVQTGQTGIYSTGSSRNIQMSASINGGGDLTITNSGIFEVLSTNNSFSGRWILEGGISFSGIGSGSLGNADFTVNDGTMDIDYDFSGSGSILELNTGGVFDLTGSSSHTFSAVTINGDALGAGTYAYNDFSPAQQSYFLDGGDTITVIPEASSLALLGLGLLIGCWTCRRSTRI